MLLSCTEITIGNKSHSSPSHQNYWIRNSCKKVTYNLINTIVYHYIIHLISDITQTNLCFLTVWYIVFEFWLRGDGKIKMYFAWVQSSFHISSIIQLNSFLICTYTNPYPHTQSDQRHLYWLNIQKDGCVFKLYTKTKRERKHNVPDSAIFLLNQSIIVNWYCTCRSWLQLSNIILSWHCLNTLQWKSKWCIVFLYGWLIIWSPWQYLYFIHKTAVYFWVTCTHAQFP